MTFQAEEYLGRIRKSAFGLVFPTLALFISAAVASYFSNVTTDRIIYNAILIGCGVVAILFWLVPVIRHLSFYIDLTSSRITIRRGLFGGQTLDKAWVEISDITFAKGGKILLQLREGESVELLGLPKPKKLAATLRSLL